MMPRLYWDIDQGSVDWFRLRSRIPTASRFSDIITPKRMELSASRKRYACEIVAGRLLNWQAESLDRVKHIEDGKRNEPIAVAQLELIREIETKPVGFVTTDDGRFGASPDRIVLREGAVQIAVECKCPTIPVQFQYLLFGHDDAYKCQQQGQLFVCEAEEAIFYAYNERTPPYYVRGHRDEGFIRKLADALEQFSDELDALTERARSLGVFQEFEELRAPLDAELGDAIRRDPVSSAEALAELLEGRGDWRA
jgi:hypothetical protein